MSDSRSRRARIFISAGLLLAGPLAGCASTPQPQPEFARQLSPSEEAEAIEAAKRHPIALTYERPRDTHSLPVAPPPIPPEPVAPPPPPQEAAQAPAAPPAPRDQVILVGEAAPPAQPYSFPSTDGNYAWVDGAWVSNPGPSVYVDAWVGPTWGVGWGYGYSRPWIYPYYAPPVVVAHPPHHHWYGHPNHGHNHYPAHHGAHRYHNAPVYRAPAAPRREVHMAPPSHSHRYAAPARMQSQAAPPSHSHRYAAPARMQSQAATPSHSQRYSAPARMQSQAAPPSRSHRYSAPPRMSQSAAPRMQAPSAPARRAVRIR